MKSTLNMLYCFITHQANLERTRARVSDMMSALNCEDYLIACGGYSENKYQSDTKILQLNCNDKYEGLPEKVITLYNTVYKNSLFDKYTHFGKLDEDMKVSTLIPESILEGIEYSGRVHSGHGRRTWHYGKVAKESIFYQTSYKGHYPKRWCKGGYGYILSRKSLDIVADYNDSKNEIYEDVMIGKLLEKNNISGASININQYIVSPAHR